LGRKARENARNIGFFAGDRGTMIFAYLEFIRGGFRCVVVPQVRGEELKPRMVMAALRRFVVALPGDMYTCATASTSFG